MRDRCFIYFVSRFLKKPRELMLYLLRNFSKETVKLWTVLIRFIVSLRLNK